MIESAKEMIWLYRQPLGQRLNRLSEIIPETQITCLNEIEICSFPLDLWCSLNRHDSQLCANRIKVRIKAKSLLMGCAVFMIVF